MRCHILLTPLVQAKEQESGYSTKGLKHLTGSGKVNPQLSFTRNEFIHELPKAQRGMSISGYQPKLQMVVRDGEFAVVEHQGEYILTPSPAEFPIWRRTNMPPCGLWRDWGLTYCRMD